MLAYNILNSLERWANNWRNGRICGGQRCDKEILTFRIISIILTQQWTMNNILRYRSNCGMTCLMICCVMPSKHQEESWTVSQTLKLKVRILMAHWMHLTSVITLKMCNHWWTHLKFCSIQPQLGLHCAERIKTEFDARWSPHWHVFIGRNFGSFVTHETKSFVFFYLEDKAVMMFKAG